MTVSTVVAALVLAVVVVEVMVVVVAVVVGTVVVIIVLDAAHKIMHMAWVQSANHRPSLPCITVAVTHLTQYRTKRTPRPRHAPSLQYNQTPDVALPIPSEHLFRWYTPENM